jgi:hypothetical protein
MIDDYENFIARLHLRSVTEACVGSLRSVD